MNRVFSSAILGLSFFVIGCGEENVPASASAPETPSLNSVVQPELSGKVTTQQQFDQVAQQLEVKFEHLTNVAGDHCDQSKADGACFKAKLSFTSPMAIELADWKIFFSQVSPVQTYESKQLNIKHINGDLHQISPKGEAAFTAGETKSLVFNAIYWSVSEHDAIPNYILFKEGFEPRIIRSSIAVIDPETGLESLPFVQEYTDIETQFKRTAGEKTQWATSSVLFERNAKLGEATKSDSVAIVPTPKQIRMPRIAGKVNLSKGIKVNYNTVNQTDVAAALSRLALFGVKETAQGVEINLSVNSELSAVAGGYQLAITPSSIDIVGNDAAGVFYGLQSIASLVTLDSNELPFVSISDEPRYDFRGMHVDVARNFLPKSFILELIDQMGAYKLNKLHLHLADDEAWRLEIPWLPELTELSSKRCLDFTERDCLLPQLGAGIEKNSSVNGYYSVDDYQEILRYASARHIQVIPSLDMPGHSRSSVKAMKLRYDNYKAQGDMNKATEFLLHDLEDTTQYSSVQFYNDNTLNVCMDSTYAFISKVMDEVKSMHEQGGQPLTRYHIGADETAGAWVESQSCKDLLANNDQGITKPKELTTYFVERIAKLLAEKGIETAGWSDGMSHTRVEKMPAKVQANIWDNLFWAGHKNAHKMINQNWEAVFSSPEVLYFDFPYEADPKEHGYYWAGRETNTRKIFELMPGNLPVHAEIWKDRMGVPFETVDDSASVIQKGKLLTGIQGQLWTETTRSVDMAQYKIYPRLFALAERAWHKPRWEPAYRHEGGTYNQHTNYFSDEQKQARDRQWHQFADTIAKNEMPKLDLLKIPYRIPTVGAKVIDGKLHANILFPALVIEYRVNGGQWEEYQQPVEVKGTVEVRARAARGERKGRTITVK